MRRLMLVLILTCASIPVSAGQGEARLKAFLHQVDSLSAEFEQVLYDEDARPLEQASGRFYLQRPGRFRWDYEMPYRQEIVSDGRQVWVYDSELEQVTVKSYQDTVGRTPAALLSSAKDARIDFEVVELGLQGDVTWVGLLPRDSEEGFNRIHLGFDEQRLRGMELMDQFGQVTRLAFSALEQNQAMDPTLFEFTPPAGADVIKDGDGL